MSGTTIGGKRAAATNKANHGEDFYHRIGKLGGKLGHTGGFTDRELARRAGKIGGRKSSRLGIKNGQAGHVENRFLIIDEQAHVPIIELSKPGFWNKLRRKV